MTRALPVSDLMEKIQQKWPVHPPQADAEALVAAPDALPEIVLWLKDTPGLEFDYLSAVTAVDYWDYFELVYQLVSLSLNQSLTLKTRLPGRENLRVASLTPLYRSADYQEREIAELFGIQFAGHPDLKPLFLWEGFPGFPLRKDYL